VNRKTIVFFSVFLLGVLVDQGTKYWVRNNIGLHDDGIQVIPGWLDIVHAENPGAAMGFLRDFQYRHQLVLAFTLVAVVIIGDLWRKLPRTDTFMSLTLGLILSGAVGNAIDRVDKQKVTDFIRVYTEYPPLESWLRSKFHTNEWPSFNVADSALVVGVGLFLVHYLFLEEKDEAPAKNDAPPPPPTESTPSAASGKPEASGDVPRT
jgi:signal peptidase II